MVKDIRDLGILQDFKFKEVKLKLDDNKSIIAQDEVMIETLNKALGIARLDSTVLILGKTGVGKEVIASIICENSIRKDKAFTRVNCAGIPENLIEIELFGYEEISITKGTLYGKPGYFEITNGGIIFLDEIGELPIKIQHKLLKVLKEGIITRVGSEEEIKVDVRVIATTNKDLRESVLSGLFEEELNYILNEISITVPDLKKRKGDISVLTNEFLKQFNNSYNRNKIIDSKVIEIFNHYTWPGNVRQLKNTVERMVVLSNNNLITIEDIPENITQRLDD